MMNSIFIIDDSFLLTTRDVFIIVGDVVSGEIVPGMLLVDEIKGVYLEILSIEIVNTVKNQGLFGLSMKYKNEAQLKYLRDLKKNDYVFIRKTSN